MISGGNMIGSLRELLVIVIVFGKMKKEKLKIKKEKKNYGIKKIEREQTEHNRVFDVQKSSMNDKEQVRIDSAVASEEAFKEKVVKSIETYAEKQKEKHRNWEIKMEKRVARNQANDHNREKRLHERKREKTRKGNC